jgi:hypothetical protein
VTNTKHKFSHTQNYNSFFCPDILGANLFGPMDRLQFQPSGCLPSQLRANNQYQLIIYQHSDERLVNQLE